MGSQDEYPDDGEYPPIKGAIVRGVWARRSGCFLKVSMTGCFHSSRLHRCPLLAEVTASPSRSVVQACHFIQVVNVPETLNQEIDQAAHAGG
jgi:hypothetical protein